MLSFKAPASGQRKIKGARGFVGSTHALRPDSFVALPRFIELTPLKAGEETTLSVALSDLPANADVKSIRARLYVADAEGDGPEPLPSAVTVTRKSDADDQDEVTELHVTASVPRRPRNLTVRLDRGTPIWTFADTLVQDSYELPDFAEQVNAYLDRVTTPDTGVTLNFLVKSDTPGSVRIVVTDKQLTRLQTQTWTNELDQTVRLDRNLDLDFGARSEIPLDAIPGAPRLVGLRLDVSGSFGPERLLGPLKPHGGEDYATVSAEYAIAQQIALDMDVEVAGVSALMAAEAPAEVYVALQHDEGGAAASATPVGQANVKLAPSEGGHASWVHAALDARATLRAGTPYWIVVKGVSGKARLGIEPADDASYLGAVLVNRTGRLWKPFAPPGAAIASMLRLVHLPRIDTESAAVEIAVRGADTQALDPQPSPTTIELELTEASLTQAVLEITSHARGALTLASVIQEY